MLLPGDDKEVYFAFKLRLKRRDLAETNNTTDRTQPNSSFTLMTHYSGPVKHGRKAELPLKADEMLV